MDGMRIILDKSVVYGLSVVEVDALDRYFEQIIPPILSNEILADLTKEAEDSRVANRIAANSYRISGNSEISESYLPLLANSLCGNEPPMNHRPIPVGQQSVQMADGRMGLVISAAEQQRTIARWERKDFLPSERSWSRQFRTHMSVKINSANYLAKIADSGVQFRPPSRVDEIGEITDDLVCNPALQGKLLYFLFKDNFLPRDIQIKAMNRWFAAGKPLLKELAPYAFFCARVNVLWAVAHANPGVFALDENDWKDREYCYYLPFCEIFASKDRKHAKLIPFLLSADQSFADSVKLKTDLGEISSGWSKLTQQDKIEYREKRGSAPPESSTSIVFDLWKKHRGTIRTSLPPSLGQMKLVDSRLPKNQQVEFTLQDLVKRKEKELMAGTPIAGLDVEGVSGKSDNDSGPSIVVKKTLMSKKRLMNLYPHLTEADLDQK